MTIFLQNRACLSIQILELYTCDSLSRFARSIISKPYKLQRIKLQLYLVSRMVEMGHQLALHPGLLQNLFLLWSPITIGTTGKLDKYSINGYNNTFLCCLSTFQNATIFTRHCDSILVIEDTRYINLSFSLNRMSRYFLDHWTPNHCPQKQALTFPRFILAF